MQKRATFRNLWLASAFIAPTLIVLVLVAGWPLARTIWFGFTDASLNDLSNYAFIGFENYLFYADGEWLGLPRKLGEAVASVVAAFFTASQGIPGGKLAADLEAGYGLLRQRDRGRKDYQE